MGRQEIEKLKLTVCQLQDRCTLTKAMLTKEQELRKTMESEHLILIKEYHATSTAAISLSGASVRRWSCHCCEFWRPCAAMLTMLVLYQQTVMIMFVGARAERVQTAFS